MAISEMLPQPEEIAELIGRASTNLEAYNIFRIFKDLVKGWRFVIASKDGLTPGFAVNKNFGSGAAVRSLFASEFVFVLDEATVEEMSNGGTTFPIDFSISLDTQAFSYIRPYLREMKGNLPADIAEVMHFIASPPVNVDPTPYILENSHTILYGKEEKKEKIFDNLLTYEILRSVDRAFLEKTGKIQSYLSEQERRTKALNLISEVAYGHSQERFFNELNRRYRAIYCVLLKTVEIQFRRKRAPLKEKLVDLMNFLDKDLGAIFARETILASKYFQIGQKLGFFGKIQSNSDSIFSNLMNMSWDLHHIHQCESGFSFSFSKEARYYFPAILTFDKKLIEVIDLCPLRMCVIMPDHNVQPVYAGDPYKKIAADSEEFASEIYNHFYSEEARKARDERRKTGGFMSQSYLDGLIQRVERDLAKAAGVEAPQPLSHRA